MNRYEVRAFLRRCFRRCFRWFLWSLPVVFFLLAVAGAFVFAGHKIAVHRQEEALAEMDAIDPGWRLEDLEAARAPVPDDENGVLVVLATAKLLPKGWPSAFDFFGSDTDWSSNQRLNFFQRIGVRIELESLNPALAEARKLATRSTGRYAIVYQRNPLATLIPHVQEARRVTRLLMLDALLRMEDDDLSEATVSCRAALNAGRSIGDEPTAISQLVRLACVRSACKAVELLLAQSELHDEDLAVLQQIIEEEAMFPGLRIAYRGDRALMQKYLQGMADGEIALDENLNKGPPTWNERCRTFFARDGLRSQFVRAFPVWNKLVEIGETPPHLRAQPLQELHTLIAAHPNDFAALTAAPLERLERSFTRHYSYLNCLAAALAAERYRHLHGDWPPSLETLEPTFLDASTVDPFDAQPLRYLRLNDGLVIYSLCPDGKGNVYDPEEPSPPGEGIAVCLWDVRQRKQDK